MHIATYTVSTWALRQRVVVCSSVRDQASPGTLRRTRNVWIPFQLLVAPLGSASALLFPVLISPPRSFGGSIFGLSFSNASSSPLSEDPPSVEGMSEDKYAGYASRVNSYEDELSTSTNGWNNVSQKHAEANEDGTFFPSEVELINVNPSFSKTTHMRGTNEDICCMNSTETDKYLALEDFPYSDEFCSLNNGSGVANTDAAPNESQALDDMLEQHDKQSLNVIVDTSIPCPDYLSDCAFAERVFHEDYKFLLENLRSDGYDEDLVNVPGQCGSVILVGLSSLIDVDHRSDSLVEPTPENMNADNMVILSERKVDEVAGELTRKRMRKPTKRYIEETSETECTLCTKRLGSPRMSSQDKIFHHLRADGVSCRLPRRGRPRKSTQNPEEDCLKSRLVLGPWVSSESENEDICLGSSPAMVAAQGGGGKCVARRKHHRLWTLAEVMKLIEGISRYGVGRWTKIKRLLFSSSGHRTSVDLKDKWRNLLRASGAHVHGNKIELEAKRKSQSGMVPQSVLRRVRDLAAIHPYPRDRSSREPLPALSWTSSS